MALRVEPLDNDAPPVLAGGAAAEPEGGLAAIRRAREHLTATRTEDFDIPGYGGLLVCRYQRLSFDEYNEALFGAEGSIVERNAQFLIAACEQFLARDDDGQLRPIVAGAITRYGDLEPVLDIEAESTRRIVIDGVFGGNELALNDHSDDVNRWMRTVHDAPGSATAALGGS